MYLQRLCFLLMVSLCWGSTLHSSTPQKAHLGSFNDWSQGKLEGLSLSSQGALVLAPQLRRLAKDVPGPILDAVLADNGLIFFSTPSPARIWKFDGVNAPTKILELDRPLVVRLKMNGSNELVALSGPGGGVHFIPVKKPWQAQYVPIKNAKMLFDLAVTSSGIFAVGGGEEGGLWQIKKKQRAKRLASFEDDALALVRAWPGQRDTLVLGTLSTGRIFKYVNGSLMALYQSEAEEVSDCLFHQDGDLIVALTSGEKGGAKKSGGTERDKQTDRAAKRNKKTSTGFAEVVRIRADATNEVLWQSHENHLHDIAWGPEQETLLAATGPFGRIFSVDPKGEAGAGIWLEVPEDDEIVKILPDGKKGVYIATAHSSAIWQASTEKTETLGLFTSSVLDMGGHAHVGRISWEPQGMSGVQVQVRTGNSSNPNEGWHGFSVAIEAPGNVNVSPGRFAQIQVQVTPQGRPGMHLMDTMQVSYQLANRSPEISAMVVSLPNLKTWRTFAQRDNSRGVTFKKDTYKAIPDSMSESERKLKGKMLHERGYRTFHVVAQDPDQDRMRYRFRLMRKESKNQMKVQEKDWSEDPFWSVDTSGLAGGTYRVEADVDDALTNGLAGAKMDSDQTGLFQVSQQGPHTLAKETRVSGKRVAFTVLGRGTSLAKVECFFPGGWLPVKPKDGITDSRSETFEVDTLKMKNLTCRFEDELGNTAQEEVWPASL